MASLPDQNGDSAPSGGGGSVRDSQRTIPTPFLTKTYELVDDPEADDLISWSEGGSTFIVWRPAEFARDVLPKYFKHNNFSSFVRQLNTYGFRKVVPDRWEFANDCFKRGEKGLLREIQRRKISPAVSASTATVAAAAAMVTAAATVTAAALPVAAASVSPTNSGDDQVISSNSSPMAVPPPMAPLLQRSRSCTTAEILEENERLRKENMQLSHELTQLRGLCNNILAMMTNYASGQLARGGAVAEDKRPPPPPAMELSPVKKAEEIQNAAVSGDAKEDGSAEEDDMEEDQEEETTPKLFGVSIGVKRVRRDEEEEDDQERQNQGSDEVVKSEPSDGSSKHDKEATWLELKEVKETCTS